MPVESHGKLHFITPNPSQGLAREPRSYAPRSRPSTEDPIALVLLDHVDSLVLSTTAMLDAMKKLAGGSNGAWTAYDRLGALYRYLHEVTGVVKVLSAMANEWGVEDPEVAGWMQANVDKLESEMRVIQHQMATVRGPITDKK